MAVSRILFMADHNCLMVSVSSKVTLEVCVYVWSFTNQLSYFPGLPPLVLRRILEILTYLATNHSAVASLLFYFELSIIPEWSDVKCSEKRDKGKEKIVGGDSLNPFGSSHKGDVPLVLFLKLLNRPLFLRSIAHLEQVGYSQASFVSYY